MLFAWVTAIMALLIAIIGSLNGWVAQDIKERSDDERALAIKLEVQRIETWYRSNAIANGAQPGVVAPPAGERRWGVYVLSSERLACNTNVFAHRYAVVLPRDNGTATIMDQVTGVVTISPGDQVTFIEGCKSATALFDASRTKAAALATSLEGYFRARSLVDGGTLTANYFTDSACGGRGGIVCTTGTGASVLATPVGLSASDFTSAYGSEFIFDNNSAAVSKALPPFSARVGFDTPWGTRFWTSAIGKP